VADIGLSQSLSRFALVGAANFVVSFAAFYMAYQYLPLGALSGRGAVANVVAYGAGMLNSFALNRAWTFRAAGPVAGHAVRFTVLNVATLALSTWTMFMLVDRAGYSEVAVWLPLTAAILVVHYVGMKHWAFAERA